MLLRRLTPGDGTTVQAFVRGLSSRSRYERFFTPIAELSPRQLERITSGAGFSIGAFDAAGRLVGLAEYACSSDEEASRLFATLSVGGSVFCPLGPSFWGATFGGLTDKFGINWLVHYAHVPAERKDLATV